MHYCRYLPCLSDIDKLFLSWKSVRCLWLGAIMLLPVNGVTEEQWSYLQGNDPGTNRSYSTVRSPLPRLDLYDDVRLEVMCKDNKLLVVLDSDSLIASQGSSFDFEYQIDKLAFVKIQMRTFPDSKRKGYTEEQAKALTEALLKGQAIFFRVNTMIRRVLTGSIPLDGAIEPIRHVLQDCGMGVDAPVTTETPYTLTEFEQALSKLSLEQQQRVLNKVRKILTEQP